MGRRSGRRTLLSALLCGVQLLSMMSTVQTQVVLSAAPTTQAPTASPTTAAPTKTDAPTATRSPTATPTTVAPTLPYSMIQVSSRALHSANEASPDRERNVVYARRQ